MELIRRELFLVWREKWSRRVDGDDHGNGNGGGAGPHHTAAKHTLNG